MQNRNKMMDDVSQLMTNAMGVAQGVRQDAETVFKSWIDRWLAENNLVTQEDFEAVRAMVIKLHEENQTLKTRLEALEKQHAAKPAKPAKSAKSTKSAKPAKRTTSAGKKGTP